MLCRYSPRIRFTTNNASNVFAALGSWTPGSPATGQTRRSTAMVKTYSMRRRRRRLRWSQIISLLMILFAACYRKVAGIKGYGFGQSGPALMSGDVMESVENTPATAKFVDTSVIPADDDTNGCPRCGGK